jgi:hypothetical protein
MTIDTDQPAVETTLPAPVAPPPALDTPATPPPVTPAVDPQAKRPTLREGLEASLKTIRERPRDDAGRFATTSPTAKQPTAAAATAATAPSTSPTPLPAVAAKLERPSNMPKAWGADKAALWTGASPELAAYLTERETQMEAFHTKHAGLGQWQEAATANGTTLTEVLERVHTVESAMASDPSQGLIQACQMVGLDRASAVQALTGALRNLGVSVGQPTPGATPPNGVDPAAQSPAADPRVDALTQQLTSLQRSIHEQSMAQSEQSVKAFAADPANKYFNEVSTDVVRELQAMRATGQTPDLKLAYERACWGRTDIREKLVAEQVAAKVPAATAAKTQELEKSRSASRSVAGAPPSAEGRSSADKPSKLRDMIAQGVHNAIGSRA